MLQVETTTRKKGAQELRESLTLSNQGDEGHKTVVNLPHTWL